ncbi:MAG: XrtA-associated tyrosine autokinase [Motiliproteus sp.]
MSTIERALEKQRQQEERKQQLSQQQEQLQAREMAQSQDDNRVSAAALSDAASGSNNGDETSAPPTLQVYTESLATTAPAPARPSIKTNHYQPPLEPAAREAQPYNNAEQASVNNREPQVNINIERLEALGMVSPTESFTQIKEEYRYIKRPLLNNAFGPGSSTLNNPNLVMVSSSFSGEGKTFTTINLAISMALEENRKVLLVDADVIKPHICERLGIAEQAGLMDYLTGKADVSDIILSTNIPNLRLITAGRRHHHSNEMIASDKMKTFMKELSLRYPDRIVIFDTSPLLGASETNVLAQMTGQAVVVVEEQRTTHPQLQHALTLLDSNMAVGLVLNKSKSRRREYYGYYANS